jgi:hypothetical protein
MNNKPALGVQAREEEPEDSFGLFDSLDLQPLMTQQQQSQPSSASPSGGRNMPSLLSSLTGTSLPALANMPALSAGINASNTLATTLDQTQSVDLSVHPSGIVPTLQYDIPPPPSHICMSSMTSVL